MRVSSLGRWVRRWPMSEVVLEDREGMGNQDVPEVQRLGGIWPLGEGGQRSVGC